MCPHCSTSLTAPLGSPADQSTAPRNRHSFHAPCMQALRTIVQQTGAHIVLSSSWQSIPSTYAQVNAALERNGLPTCVDKTVGGGPTRAGESARAHEIAAWVAANPASCAAGYVAIDDLDLAPHLARGTFVRTEAESGLTEADAMRAIDLLGGPDPSVAPLPPPPHKPGGFNVVVTRGEVQRDMMRAAMAGL